MISVHIWWSDLAMLSELEVMSTLACEDQHVKALADPPE